MLAASRSMPRRRAPLVTALMALWAALVVGCSASATQLVVVIDTDLALGVDIDAISVEVTSPDGTKQTERAPLTAADTARLPLTLGVSPSGNDLGPVLVRATASLRGTHVVAREHRAVLEQGETRTLVMHLTRGCAQRETACSAGLTCTESGCSPVTVAGDDLPPWSGAPPRLDSPPPIDAGRPTLDAGPDGATDSGPVVCTLDAECDDGNECTTERCVDGLCVRSDNTLPCDDGIFCNGRDTCGEGSCSIHSGPPCGGSTICDETVDLCVGCTTDGDCPDPTTVTSACMRERVASLCDTRGTRFVDVTSYSCVGGSCIANPTERLGEGCEFDTSGIVCQPEECGEWGACTNEDPCAETGTQRRLCTEATRCDRGECPRTRVRTETRACTRVTSGMPCGDTQCLSGLCTGTGCSQTGERSVECTSYACSRGMCQASLSRTTESCTRNTDGDRCNDGLPCTHSDTCAAGICRGLATCGVDCDCTSSGCVSRSLPPRVCLEIIEL